MARKKQLVVCCFVVSIWFFTPVFQMLQVQVTVFIVRVFYKPFSSNCFWTLQFLSVSDRIYSGKVTSQVL